MEVSAMTSTKETHHELVSVLEADADLRAVIPSDEVELARRNLVAEAISAPAGPWDPDVAGSEAIGLLVLEGLLLRELEIGPAKSLELLGVGDLLRPWDIEPDPDLSPLSAEVAWTILEPARFALLDLRFAAMLGRWPKLGNEIMRRIMRRSRWLAVRLAISSLQSVADRVALLLWHLATTWGRVTPDGTIVPVSLTHELIAELIGARRPSVTTAIGELRDTGRVERLPEGWLLTAPPPGAESGRGR
jgi:hypothetical protein